VYDMLTEARANAPQVELVPSPQFEGPLWALVTERPVHLLAPKYESWQGLLMSSLETALTQSSSSCEQLSRCTWGRENTLSMRHPLSSAIPFVARWLDMPAVPMNGDASMPRVQSPSFGASERVVVSPGREAEGLIQMPGGPVNHPLSPFYGAGHDEWVRGEARSLLPGKAGHVLTLAP
jgi:penicillin amidase